MPNVMVAMPQQCPRVKTTELIEIQSGWMQRKCIMW